LRPAPTPRHDDPPAAEDDATPTLPFYVGAFLGPFGGGVVAVLIPQLRDAFHTSTGVVAASVPVYLVPFAVLQLVSGTLGERWGRRRTVRTAYGAYALTSVAAAVATGVATFMIARAAAGVANAFLTPLLLAGLADATPPKRLGRSVGTFAAVQTAAVAMAPLCGGLLGAIDWRLVFLVPAVVALVLAKVPPSGEPRASGEKPPRLRALVTRRVVLVCTAIFAASASVVGLSFLVALHVADHFGVGSIARGFVLAGFGLAGMVAGRAAGRAVDRFDRVPVVIVGAVGSGVLVATLGVAPGVAVLTAIWTSCGIGMALILAPLNTLSVEIVPENRGGAASVVSAFRIGGTAAAPLLWLPVYHVTPWLGFAGAGTLAAASALPVLPLRRAPRPAADSA
jgi:MFS family permease